MSACSDLISFADGELEPARAEAFREHLQTCETCRVGLVEALQLSAQLSALTPRNVDAKRTRDDSQPPETPSVPRLSWPKRLMWGTGILVTSGVAAIVALRCWAPVDAFAGLEFRSHEVRLAYAGAASYRPLAEVVRGDRSSRGQISFEAIGALERTGDRHGVAIAQAWNSDIAALPEAIQRLRGLPQTPVVRSDRVALEALTTSRDNLQPVLAELEQLARSDDLAAARAARWNHALLLSRLELPLSAARTFEAIASEQEAGWSDEARRRAATERERASDFRSPWLLAGAAGQRLVEGGPPVASELVRARPGVLRAYFYQAVRVAPTRDRVLALAAMADDLDRAGGAEHALRDYVQRVAAADFRGRAPLARAYADLVAGKRTPDAAALVSETAPDDVVDIVMGAMVERDAVAAHRAWFRRAAARAQDPWFEIVLARSEADAELAAGNWQGAEALLVRAIQRCAPALVYQCATLVRRLGRLYADEHRVHDAVAVLQTTLRTVRGAGEWDRYRVLLMVLADVERFPAATAVVRAYANEALLMYEQDAGGGGDDCLYRSSIHRLLAGAAIVDLDGVEARRQLDDAPRCSSRTVADALADAILLADVARLAPRPDDLAQLRDQLSAVRTVGRLTDVQRSLADETEGRLVIEHDRAAGAELLHKAIAAADALSDGVADQARAGAYAVLAFDAVRAHDDAQALHWIAEALRRSPPSRCAVGIVAEDERATVVVRGADGRDLGWYEPRRALAAALTVPAELARTLAGCERVEVLAAASLQGQPRVLPDELAWSYTGGHEPAAPAAVSRALVIADVAPPDYLHLAQLAAQPPDPDATLLAGPAATPSRVLAAMADASEIQFHTHALMDVGLSDASHLVLSPEPSDGHYALTAEAIRGAQLRGRPVVVLAACHSAQGPRYQHAPWSLPAAFLTAGARAVFATTTDIPDAESSRFFASLLARVRAGTAPAVALREQRLEVLRVQPSSWVADVVVFE